MWLGPPAVLHGPAFGAQPPAVIERCRPSLQEQGPGRPLPVTFNQKGAFCVCSPPPGGLQLRLALPAPGDLPRIYLSLLG